MHWQWLRRPHGRAGRTLGDAGGPAEAEESTTRWCSECSSRTPTPPGPPAQAKSDSRKLCNPLGEVTEMLTGQLIEATVTLTGSSQSDSICTVNASAATFDVRVSIEGLSS
mmetsp:Transcript_54362/g.175758  ORF Transcript_54362/g.175758 Transcript_54362/m.175758 type:complete len:111 (+) Transcript_54362:1141-1473(+)